MNSIPFVVENVASTLVLSGCLCGRERKEQMLNFRVKIDSITTHDSYAAWREGQHDDLFLSMSLADWWEKLPETTTLNLLVPPICPHRLPRGWRWL